MFQCLVRLQLSFKTGDFMKHCIITAIAAILGITQLSKAETAAWTGSISSDFTDSNNWNPAINLLDGTGDVLTIGSGSPYDPVYNNGTIPRPSSLSTLNGAFLTMAGGDLIPWGSSQLNGRVDVLGGNLNIRSNVFVGSGGTGTMNVSGGSFTARNVLTLGSGSGGDGTLNISGGTVYLGGFRCAYNGGTGRMSVTGNGKVYCTGDNSNTFQAMVKSGLLTTTSGSVININYDSVNNRTIVEALPAPYRVSVPREMENIDRGVVAVKVSSGVFVSWRMLGTEPDEIAYNIYRGTIKINAVPMTSVTNLTDTAGTLNSTYSVAAVLDGIELEKSVPVGVWAQQYMLLPLQRPAGCTTPDGVAYTYSPGDCSVGDLDGDGQYEIVLKWDPSNGKDNSHDGYTGNVYLDGYKMDGTFLWRIDLGRNIRAGAHYTQFMVYDLDGDGWAEVACKTADATIDGTGAVIGDINADYRNSSGRVLDGPEFLTIFNGLTGAALATTDYIPARGNVCDWGDCYGNRVDRFLACVAYLDGQRPSLVMCRGYYTRTVLAAWNWRDGQLTSEWVFDSDNGYPDYAGRGNHSIAVGDVDGDGCDEIMYGAMAVDNDGTGMYTLKNLGLGHGDAGHLTDIDPDQPGLEFFTIHEGSGNNAGSSLRNAATGQVYWTTEPGDVGRGLAVNIDPTYRGAECWGYGAFTGLRSCTNEVIASTMPSSCNFAVWWDGDLQRELLNGGVIDKWNYVNSSTGRVLSAYKMGANGINGTKNTPCLSADLLGDWREEIIWRYSNNEHLIIFTTTTPTMYRFRTLMHDPIYRLSIAWQNVGYNQPPHTGFYIGTDMDMPARQDITLAGKQTGSILRDYWTGITGTVVNDLVTNINYPGNPNSGQLLTRLETVFSWDNNFADRTSGYLHPTASGSYTFWIAGQDECELWLSSDANPANRSRIAFVSGSTNPREWTRYASQQSTAVPLQAGHKYYIEVLRKAGVGTDHLAVAWQGPTFSRKIIDGFYLSPRKEFLFGDLDGNQTVNTDDLSLFSDKWLLDDCDLSLLVDWNGDCRINLLDFERFSEKWLAL
jgi:hypothetical protein